MNPNTIAIFCRQTTDDRNHHLWNNNGNWWLHCTIHLADFTKWRLRKNLRTSDVRTARRLRDQILAGSSALFFSCVIPTGQPAHEPLQQSQ